jgi:uncharacterized protein YndB with AHSA1/START domain
LKEKNTFMKSNIKGRATISIDATAAKVWEALTTPSIIKKYFFGTDAISDWQPGSPLIFKGEWEGKKYEDKGTILNVIPNALFKYTYWSSMSGIEDKPENYVIITYELSENNGKTLLTITQENIPDEKMKDHSEQNWKKVLTDLKNLLETEDAVVN